MNTRSFTLRFFPLMCYFLIIIIGGESRADDVGRGGYAGSAFRMGVGARFQAMGGDGVAFGDDCHSMYYNPGGLVFLPERQVGVSLMSLALDRKVQFVCYAQSFQAKQKGSSGRKLKAGFAVGWLNAGVDEIDGRDMEGIHTQMYSFSENCFYFSFAIQPAPFLGIGLSSKVLYSRIPDILPDGGAMGATGFGFDVGVLIQPCPDVHLGLVIRDLNSRYSWNSQELYDQGRNTHDHFPYVLDAGLMIKAFQGSHFQLSVSQTKYFPPSVHFGVEQDFVWFQNLKIRGGIQEKGFSFGWGYQMQWNKKRVVIDYAYVPDPVAPRGDHVFSWAFGF